MTGGGVTGQMYEKNTNVLMTSFEGPDGAFELIDFMPRYTSDGRAGAADDIGPDVVRKIRHLRGAPRIKVSADATIGSVSAFASNLLYVMADVDYDILWRQPKQVLVVTGCQTTAVTGE